MRRLSLIFAFFAASLAQADEKDEFVVKQRANATATLKKCGVANPGMIETQNLIVCGGFPEEKLKTMGEAAQKHYTAVMKSLKFETTDNPPKGKVTVYFFPERKQLGLFVGDVVNDKLERDERGHADPRNTLPHVAVSVLPGEKPTDLDAEALNQISILLLQAKGSVHPLPGWMQDGFARTMRMRLNPGKYVADRSRLRSIYQGAKVSDGWAPGTDKDKLLIAASLVEYFAYGPDTAKFGRFLTGFRVIEGDPAPTFDAVLKGADLDMAKLETGWKKWVRTGK